MNNEETEFKKGQPVTVEGRGLCTFAFHSTTNDARGVSVVYVNFGGRQVPAPVDKVRAA